MKVSDSAKNWIIAIGLLIFAGIASAAWLYFSSQDSAGKKSTQLPPSEPIPVIIKVEDYVLGSDLLQIDLISDFNGTEISQGLVILVAFGLLTALMLGLGLAISLISWFTSRQVSAVVGDEDYQKARVNLDQLEKERLKELHDRQPTNDLETEEQVAKSSWFATSLLIILLIWIAGLTLSATFLADITWSIVGIEVSAALVVNLLLILTTAVILYVVARTHEPAELSSGVTDNYPINWGTVWVWVTGLIIVGIGTGLAIAMRSIG
ncbi:MAG: hypothetical protein BMS9Abin02_0448 [Anaerolineae bacterium]|nr:MAG: hypothetical protein BMS9Abin02_0448 [Anaerolineae bacterium]